MLIFLFSISATALSKKNIDDLEDSTHSTNIGFEVIVNFESRLLKTKFSAYDVSLASYNYELYSKEVKTGGKIYTNWYIQS